MSWQRPETRTRLERKRRTGDSRGPEKSFPDRFRPWHRSRTVLGGPQIASCELGRAGARPIGAILAGPDAHKLGFCLREWAARRSEAQQ